MKSKKILLVHLGGFFLAAHFATVAYVNSSLLKQLVGNSSINLLYALGSLLGLILLALVPFLLRQHGSVPVFLFFIVLEVFAVLGMGISTLAHMIIILFLIHIAVDSVLYFCMDLHLEQETDTEGSTGRNRGFFLTASNAAWVLSPLLLALLVTEGDFSNIYFLSGAALIPLFIIAKVFFKNTEKAKAATANVLAMMRALLKGGDKARIIGVQFALQFFFAWMVIYLPLLLNLEIGFGWDKIGPLFTIMLFPFLLFELPAGFLSDKKIGEKEILFTGLAIMVLATLAIPNISLPVFAVWAAVLFATRVGASLVEVACESYFFKHVKEDDTALISLFRMARPFSYIIAPVIAIPVLIFFSYSASFYFLAGFTAFGLFFVPKVDTR